MSCAYHRSAAFVGTMSWYIDQTDCTVFNQALQFVADTRGFARGMQLVVLWSSATPSHALVTRIVLTSEVLYWLITGIMHAIK